MPDTLAEGLFALLFLLFGIVLPLVLRARGAAQRSRQLGGLRPPPPGLPRAPEEEGPGAGARPAGGTALRLILPPRLMARRRCRPGRRPRCCPEFPALRRWPLRF